MSSPLEAQAKTWVETISSEETIAAYQKVLQSLITAVQALWDAILVSWTILKETGKLVWLFICLGLVAFDWLIDGVKKLFEKIKGLSEQTSNVDNENYFADISKVLLEAGKTSAVQAVSQAREQLGMPKAERPTAATPPVAAKPAAPAPSPAPSPAAKTTSDAPKATAADESTESAGDS